MSSSPNLNSAASANPVTNGIWSFRLGGFRSSEVMIATSIGHRNWCALDIPGFLGQVDLKDLQSKSQLLAVITNSSI